MQKEIKAALAAAKKFTPRNEGARTEHEVTITLLTDALMHADRLDDLADGWERTERLRLAQVELRDAQA